MSKSEIILLLSPVVDASAVFASTLEILKKFEIPVLVTPMKRKGAVAHPLNRLWRKENIFCVIAHARIDIIRWAKKHFADTPILLAPHGENGVEALEALIRATQHPAGEPMAVFALGKAGATNTALFAMAMLALKRPTIRNKLLKFRKQQTQAVLAKPIPGK
ncbi:MAG: AIR carboxylase family protein [Verrucomicrobiota bacterium]